MEVFFREWERRAPGETRDVGRARALASALGLLAPGVPVLTVVGSKGKGTAATYASAFLGAAGLRVCTVTSPGLRSNRDRIRVDGRAVSAEELASLADVLGEAVAALPPPSGGYLSPSGLFTIAGVLHARRVGADALVLEAGMGGRSDEVALFPPDVAAITPVFREHAGVLGDTPAEIAEEKLGVAGPRTRVLSAPQSAEVARVLGAVEFVGPGGSGLPRTCFPPVSGARRPNSAWSPPAASPERKSPPPGRCGPCCPRSSCPAACPGTPCPGRPRGCWSTPRSTGPGSPPPSAPPGRPGGRSTTPWSASPTTRTWTAPSPRWARCP
ncbi:hypothetical protein ACFQY7_25690 [Actinomadura luteofluorescens]|uniref:hypothetical protein n=1 Tax=Actinomadura luteofluorescens TaxID=46163 RepID=UPI0036389652